jgi:uncharacterized protein YdhG (YjbR/CyaY superfamily)
MARLGPSSVEDYLASMTDGQRAWLDELRATIRAVLPDATEEISYQIVAFKVKDKAVIYYAAFQEHYSLYPVTDAMREALGDEIKPYLSGKGTVRLPGNKPVPKTLVRKIVRVLRDANEAAARRA